MRTTVVIIGAGHAGLAMSHSLAEHSIDHVVIERGTVAHSWRTERWDSLRLLTPNWMSRLPGAPLTVGDPDGFRTMPETVAFIERYAAAIGAPVHTDTTVLSVRPRGDGYLVTTTQGTWQCQAVVVATGACNLPSLPPFATRVPAGVTSLTPRDYRNPSQLAPGGVLVVGAAASGIQIAEEIQRSGRPVTLSVGEHVRVPRRYRGRDITWWMDRVGVFDESYTEVDSVERVRGVASLQLIGSPEHRDLDLNALTGLGVRLVGRLAGISGGRAQCSGSLPNLVRMADLKMNRLLARIDAWASSHLAGDEIEPPHSIEPTRVDASPPLAVDLTSGEIRTVIWATGYRPDHSWLDVPVFDRKGRIRHDGGVAAAPGLYLIGMPFLRRRRSSLIDGAASDARDLSTHLASYLADPAAAGPAAPLLGAA